MHKSKAAIWFCQPFPGTYFLWSLYSQLSSCLQVSYQLSGSALDLKEVLKTLLGLSILQFYESIILYAFGFGCNLGFSFLVLKVAAIFLKCAEKALELPSAESKRWPM